MKNRKRCFLVLLILTLVGVVGYGVYSYYYASGSVTHTGTIEVDGFDVTVYSSFDYEFISGTHNGSWTCDYSSGELFICDVGLRVDNKGDNDVSVEIDNFDVTLDGMDNATVTDYSISNNGFTSISAGSYDVFYITVKVEVPGYEEPSDDAVQLAEPITGGELTVTATYDIVASEVH